VIQPATWLARTSGRSSLNGFNLESSSTPKLALEPESIGRRPADEDADVLGRLGVSHVVTTSDALSRSLASSSRFASVWNEPPIAIFALLPPAGHPDPASLVASAAPATAELRRADPERLRIDVDATRATQATVAVAWSPKWHGRVDGRVVALDRTDDGLIAVRLPAGRSTLELSYGPDGWDRAGVVSSAVTLALLVALGARAWRRRGRASPV
jgi:hypothetical protein